MLYQNIIHQMIMLPKKQLQFKCWSYYLFKSLDPDDDINTEGNIQLKIKLLMLNQSPRCILRLWPTCLNDLFSPTSSPRHKENKVWFNSSDKKKKITLKREFLLNKSRLWWMGHRNRSSSTSSIFQEQMKLCWTQLPGHVPDVCSATGKYSKTHILHKIYRIIQFCFVFQAFFKISLHAALHMVTHTHTVTHSVSISSSYQCHRPSAVRPEVYLNTVWNPFPLSSVFHTVHIFWPKYINQLRGVNLSTVPVARSAISSWNISE